MACKTSFELYHNFPKLAEESGFTFNTHRPRVHIEWNKIRLVDIESLIRERKFALIEQHVNDILDCILESEFDVRILDEGVLKIFRLAQLAVEYHQFCRHYLDRSVYVLREEVSALAQELDATKRLLKEKEEEVRKLRRRSKHSFRTPLPYGNDNIATMILKTLNNKADIFPTLTSSDSLQHNKCTYCDKVFLNQLYLESHVARRHANMTEIPQKDTDNIHVERSGDENNKLFNEVTELRSKLADMEKVISNFGKTNSTEINTNNDNKKIISEHSLLKEMKDVEVSTNGEGYILDKIEEWKKEEHEKYSKEIKLLRTQIIDMIDTYKEKERQQIKPATDEPNIMTELNTMIKEQGAEISALKQELAKTKSNPNAEEIELRKKIEEQMAYWVKRAEMQSNEYKLLLQKLDTTAKEAEQSRAQAEAERARAAKLQDLLQQKNEKLSSAAHTDHNLVEKSSTDVIPEPGLIRSDTKSIFIRDRNMSLQKLQQKAQELLNIENTSTSETSPSSDEKILKKETNNKNQINKNIDINKKSTLNLKVHRSKRKLRKNSKEAQLESNKNNQKLNENSKTKKENGAILAHGSPMKIVRAKITEEVNNRLVSLGVDPLKSRLPQNIFIRQKMQLQEQKELKFKKYPGSDQILHSLLARLDSHVTEVKKDKAEIDLKYNSPNKNPKAFSLSSVLSNVKTKALSLVKTNDSNKYANKSYDSVAKKAMILLRTPPSSSHSSPKERHNKESPERQTELQNSKTLGIKIKSKNKSYLDNKQVKVKAVESDSESTVSNNEKYNKTPAHVSKSIENLIKSPTQYPSNTKIPNYLINEEKKENVIAVKPEISSEENKTDNINGHFLEVKENSSDDVESLINHSPRRAFSEENIIKQTKGVLKNASSTSSLNKKKVIFDMDAIQMKSVSASSPSQSVTERSDNNEKYGLGLINFDNEEWDISSIENEPDKKNRVLSRTSPKIAELKQTIESQLSRRNITVSTALVGGVDVLTGATLKKSAVGGSNTSLGSSILDDTDSTPAQNQVAYVKPRTFIDKDDSEIDISEFVADDIITRNAIKGKLL